MVKKRRRAKHAKGVTKASARRKKSLATGRAGRITGIAPRQLSLPAGFSADGSKIVPLRDVLSPNVPTMELTQLSPSQQADLTAERIRRQKRFKMGMVGVGVLDKARAIAEVKAQTLVGRTLVEIENRALRMIIGKARGVK